MRFPGRSHFVPEQAASISLAVIFCRLFVEIFRLTASPIFRYDGFAAGIVIRPSLGFAVRREDFPASGFHAAAGNRKIYYLQSKIDSTPHSVTAPEDASTVKSYSIRL